MRTKRASRPQPRELPPVAVIDIGSNSGRVVVYRSDRFGQLQIQATTRAALRLVRDVDDERRLSDAAVARTLEALRDFRAIALGAGARRIVAIATAAVRDAANGPQLVARARRELGIRIEVIDAEREARYGFLGAVHGLPVSDGLFFDLGGGSLQISRFAGRRLGPGWSLPLGALRLSHRFLQDDPPAGSELRRLLRHVRNQLAKARVPALPAGGELVGTGGTLRNLAKVDRAARDYPIERLHGYVLARDRVAAIVRVLARQPLARRDRIAGLSDERGDSIVGGALAIEALMDHVGARHIRVSGQGSREGIVHALLRDSLPSPAVVRQASLASFARRFATFDAATAERRRALAAVLARQLLRRAPRDLREALEHAALLLDVGRSMDFFDRHEHVASIVVATELNGFSHRDIALVAAITLAAREQQRADFRTLLGAEDREDVARAGLLLALADDVIERCRPGPRVRARCHRTASAFHLTVPGLLAWRPRNIGPRFERLFGRELVVRPGGVGGARQRAGAGPAAARPRTRV